MENGKIKFLSTNLLKVSFLAFLWYVFIFKGFNEFFYNLRSTTVAEALGALTVPIVPSYFIARYLSIKKGMNFEATWIVCTFVIFGITTIGMLNGKHHWW